MATGDQSRGFCKHSDHPWTKYDNVIPTIPLSWSIYIVYNNNLSVLYVSIKLGVRRWCTLSRGMEGTVNAPVGLLVGCSAPS